LLDSNVANIYQKLPLKIDTFIDAQQLIGSACKLHVEYQEMKVASLQHLQKLLEEVKWINNKLLEVDIHIGQIYHVVNSSGYGIPPPEVARKEHTIIIEGCESLFAHYHYSYLQNLLLYSCACGSTRCRRETWLFECNSGLKITFSIL
jgi:hypothetical protein